jgi:anaerobic ribonucleoside-triphosphate reductase activating protein
MLEQKVLTNKDLSDIITSYNTDKTILNVHAMVYDSEVNGPGKRMVIWFRGCPFACKGCFNPETWNFQTANIYTVDSLFEKIKEYQGDGVTFSGGEPMMQPYQFLELLKKIETLNFKKGVLCFTGFEVKEIENFPIIKECMEYIDVTVAGRYVEELRQHKNIAGSSNQKFIFSNREGRGKAKIELEEIQIDQEVEIHESSEDGTLQITGFPDINRKLLKKFGIEIIK